MGIGKCIYIGYIHVGFPSNEMLFPCTYPEWNVAKPHRACKSGTETEGGVAPERNWHTETRTRPLTHSLQEVKVHSLPQSQYEVT